MRLGMCDYQANFRQRGCCLTPPRRPTRPALADLPTWRSYIEENGTTALLIDCVSGNHSNHVPNIVSVVVIGHMRETVTCAHQGNSPDDMRAYVVTFITDIGQCRSVNHLCATPPHCTVADESGLSALTVEALMAPLSEPYPEFICIGPAKYAYEYQWQFGKVRQCDRRADGHPTMGPYDKLLLIKISVPGS